MWFGQAPKLVTLVAVTGLLTGCAETGGITLPRRTSMGTLKTSLSHLEYENQQLRKEVAQLKTDSRDVENRLVQEETDNGDLRARLNDARLQLSQRGIDFDAQSSSTTSRDLDSDPDAKIAIPAGQSNRKRRKPPFAQIPGGLKPIPRLDFDDDEHVIDPKPLQGDAFGPQSSLNDPDRWLPIAHGTTASDTKKQVR
ncbi:hypothetical protein [Singulisphaera acidiphila]|uniref:Uncharacterized protein n=1 Tax=Singulisphaera acidiphila (strain ATCC BAA-1392 / DSM 18658 / VKM B-2454 / MOB10) TaxID=886293 RepID=L0DC36_SINAD|nr:hypothetical protein [Singulisphaera acidiphila]AGA26939.1 hypothetical protein Sinac_2637 [Singulisphaera acidiphila DSM 18658]